MTGKEGSTQVAARYISLCKLGCFNLVVSSWLFQVGCFRLVVSTEKKNEATLSFTTSILFCKGGGAGRVFFTFQMSS